MKKTCKKLFGIGGLALVAGITAVAYHIPDAGAVSTSASAKVDVSVNVASKNPEIRIDGPLDGAKLTNPNLHIKVTYADADKIEYTLTKDGKTVVIPAPDLSGNDDGTHGNNGVHDFIYNLKNFDPTTAGYGDYVLKIVIERGSTKIEDTVSFSYSAATIEKGSITTDENGNPIVELGVGEAVQKVDAIVVGQNGEELFRTTVDTNGTSPAYITLPFFENNMDSGNYTVKFITYSYNGLGQLVSDQTEDSTDIVTTVTYVRKPASNGNNANSNADANSGANSNSNYGAGTGGHNSTDEPSSSDNKCPTADLPNPVLDIEVEEGVRQIEFIIYDASGSKEMFRYKAFVSSALTNHIALPFNLHCLEEGVYLVAAIPYALNENGDLVPLISEDEAKKNAFKIFYGVSEIPNTGDILSSIDIPYKDLLISGLIIFFIITFIGILILRREEKEEDRRQS